MIEMLFHNASLWLTPKGEGAEEKINKLADFLEQLEEVVWEEEPLGVSSEDLTGDPDLLGEDTDKDAIPVVGE